MKRSTDESTFFLSVCQFSASGIQRRVCHCCSLNGGGGSVFIEFINMWGVCGGVWLLRQLRFYYDCVQKSTEVSEVC